MRTFALFLSLMIGPALLCAADRNDATTKQVMAAQEALSQAMIHKDAAALERLLSPDLLYTHSAGAFETEPQMIKAIMNGKSPIEKIDLSDTMVRQHGDTVLVKTKFDLQHSPTDIAHLNVLFVWQKTGGNWQLIGRQATKLP